MTAQELLELMVLNSLRLVKHGAMFGLYYGDLNVTTAAIPPGSVDTLLQQGLITRVSDDSSELYLPTAEGRRLRK